MHESKFNLINYDPVRINCKTLSTSTIHTNRASLVNYSNKCTVSCQYNSDQN